MKILECIPNFSEGRDIQKIQTITDIFRDRPGIKLLNSSHDTDHNRMVITAAGEPEALMEALLQAVGKAVELIDMNQHQGAHPCIGAADVIPFVPIRGMNMEEAITLAAEFARAAAEQYSLPIFLYEHSARFEHRRKLEDIRRGGFAGLKEKLTDAHWQPDFGPPSPHASAGCTVVGARRPLIAFNVNLRSQDLSIAKAIAKRVRHSGGGLRGLKAIGVDLKAQGMVQVSMNLTDYTQTSVYQAVEMVRMEAARYGVSLAGSELIGLMPLEALTDTAAYYLGLENFTPQQILEMKI